MNKFQLAEAFTELTIRDTKFKRVMSRVHASLDRLQKKFKVVARHARRFLMVGGVAFAGMVTQAAAFEQSMARVQALTGATSSQLRELSSAAREMGRTTVFTARQSAEAMSAFALAGFDTNKILRSLKPTLDLAAAAQMDIGTAAEISAKIMAGMRLGAGELGHAVDVLTKAFTTSQTNMVMLGDAMKFVGPVAKASGKSIEETVAIIQVLSNVGIQGSLAGTSLRNMLARLAKEGPEVRKVFKSLGVEIKTVAGHIRPLADIVDDFNAALRRQGREAEATGLAMLAFGMRAGPGFSALLQEGGDEIRRFEKQLQDAAGTAEYIAEIQLNTFEGQLRLMQSALQDVSIEMGKAFIPMLRSLSSRLTGLAASIGELDAMTKDSIVNWTLFTGAVAGLLVVAPLVIGAMKGITAAVAVFAGGAAMGGVVGVAVLALGALGAAFLAAKMKGEEFHGFIAKLIKDITGLENEVTRLASTLGTQEGFKGARRELGLALGANQFGGALAAVERMDQLQLRAGQRLKSLETELANKQKAWRERGPLARQFTAPGSYPLATPGLRMARDAFESQRRLIEVSRETLYKQMASYYAKAGWEALKPLPGKLWARIHEGLRQKGAFPLKVGKEALSLQDELRMLQEERGGPETAAAAEANKIREQGMKELLRWEQQQRDRRAQRAGGTLGFAALQGAMQKAVSEAEEELVRLGKERNQKLDEIEEAVSKIKVEGAWQ